MIVSLPRFADRIGGVFKVELVRSPARTAAGHRIEGVRTQSLLDSSDREMNKQIIQANNEWSGSNGRVPQASRRTGASPINLNLNLNPNLNLNRSLSLLLII
jgi:hypothetical protein